MSTRSLLFTHGGHICRRGFAYDDTVARFGQKLCQLIGVPKKSVLDLLEVRLLRTVVH